MRGRRRGSDGSAVSAIVMESSMSSRHPGRPNHHRVTPRTANAAASGDPTMTLPFVGSPSAKSMVACAHRPATSISPVWALMLIPLNAARTVRAGSPIDSSQRFVQQPGGLVLRHSFVIRHSTFVILTPMSQFVPPRPRVINVKRGFVIVASQFNAKYVQGLVNHCSDELRALSPASNVDLHLVPGAFEIPLLVREVALKKKRGRDRRVRRNHSGRNRTCAAPRRGRGARVAADFAGARRPGDSCRPQFEERSPG